MDMNEIGAACSQPLGGTRDDGAAGSPEPARRRPCVRHVGVARSMLEPARVVGRCLRANDLRSDTRQLSRHDVPDQRLHRSAVRTGKARHHMQHLHVAAARWNNRRRCHCRNADHAGTTDMNATMTTADFTTWLTASPIPFSACIV